MTREYTVWRGSTLYTNTLLRARHEGRGLFADGGLDLPEIARQLGNLLYEDRLRYYKTVNTRRHRLKQPKFVLRCVVSRSYTSLFCVRLFTSFSGLSWRLARGGSSAINKCDTQTCQQRAPGHQPSGSCCGSSCSSCGRWQLNARSSPCPARACVVLRRLLQPQSCYPRLQRHMRK